MRVSGRFPRSHNLKWTGAWSQKYLITSTRVIKITQKIPVCYIFGIDKGNHKFCLLFFSTFQQRYTSPGWDSSPESASPPMETESFLRPAITPRPRADDHHSDDGKKSERGGRNCDCCRASSAVLGGVLLMAGLAAFLVVGCKGGC